MIDLHAINMEITSLYSMKSIAAIDSFMIHTCKYSTAMRRKAWNNYTDPVSGWLKTTKGNLHDSHVSHDMVDSVRNFSYILADSAYDASDIYNYVFENNHAIPVIGTKKRRGIIPYMLPVNRKIGIDLRKEYASLYPLRWEMERAFRIKYEIGRKALRYNENRYLLKH